MTSTFDAVVVALARALADATWQASFAALVILVAERLMPRAASRWRAALLTLAVLRFAWPPSLGLPEAWSARLPVATHLTLAPLDPGAGSMQGPAWVWWAGGALLVWGMGALVSVLGLIAARARLSSRLRPVPPYTAEGRRVRALARAMRLTRVPALARSPEAAAPYVFGWRHPVLVLPERGLEPGEARLALLHELAHIRRGDLMVREITAWLGALWWWNPLFAMTDRRLREVQEEACDDLAIAAAGAAPERYGRMIVRQARAWRLAVDLTPAKTAAGLTGPSLERRLRRLLDPRHGVPSRLSIVHLALVAIAVAPALPRAATPPWRVVHAHSPGLSEPRLHIGAGQSQDDAHRVRHQARHRSHH